MKFLESISNPRFSSIEDANLAMKGDLSKAIRVGQTGYKEAPYEIGFVFDSKSAPTYFGKLIDINDTRTTS